MARSTSQSDDNTNAVAGIGRTSNSISSMTTTTTTTAARRNSLTCVVGVGAGSSRNSVTAPSVSFNPTAATAAASGGEEANSTRNNNNNSNSNNMRAIDFIGSSTAVKHLFSLPYNNNKSMSMALHNLGNGTFLLDSGEEFIGTTADASTISTSAQANNNSESSSAASSFIEGTFFRRGSRRRQRPMSWSKTTSSTSSIGDQQEEEEEEEDTSETTTTTTTATNCELNPMHIAQLREKEHSLLTSLASLLEKEQQDVDETTEKEIVQTGHRLLDTSTVHEEEYAVIIPSPSNAIIVSQNSSGNHAKLVGGAISESENPIVGSAIDHETMIDPTDALGAILPPPQHYLSQYAGVVPPSEPRQYVHWNFRDMKLLVASDALIYNQEVGGGTEGGMARSLELSDEEVTTTRPSSTSSMISIRIEDASELKSQMLDMTENRGGWRLIDEVNASRNERLSYADALLLPSSKKEYLKGDDHVGGGQVMTATENVEIVTSLIPSSLGVEPPFPMEWASRLGFTHSPVCPQPNMSHDDSCGVASIDADHSSSASDAGVEFEGTNDKDVSTTPSSSSSPDSTSLPLVSSTPICTVLDAYLDNIMANVPQLALILREHGFVQNIKLLRTEDIPSLMMHPSTLGGGETCPHDPSPPPIFSPDIVEMNAAMLLRFLKTNCTRENSTYLLHRAAGEANIQLFDITSISKMRQRKWVWWLALCSYRFACRLDQLRTNVLSPHDDVLRRDYRRRQRSLLQNTLDLLEELADMDGGRRHDTIGAAVCEHLADTFLWNNDEDGVRKEESARRTESSSGKSPSPCASSSQPYRKVTVDCLNKAHDHLMNGVNKLTPLLVKARQDHSPIEIEALSTQLYGIYHKVVNVNLRLADRHLQNYFSSNLIQSLRQAARILSDATSLLDEQKDQKYIRSIALQYCWIWEYCGHFARSFAADGLWRDRGHTCGADLIGLLREVNMSCGNIRKQCFGAAGWKPKVSVDVSSHGQVTLNSLSGIVILPKDFEQIEESVLQKEGCHEAIGAAKAILDQKTQIKRDALLVLVAASICFGYSIDSYAFLASCGPSELFVDESKDCNTAERQKGVTVDGVNLISSIPGDTTAVLSLLRRLGDACNEIGKMLLDESRAVLLPQYVPPENINSISNTSFGLSHVSAIMLSSAKFWFVEGLERFTQGKDTRNTALLRCNLCQCCKIRANTNVILPGSSEDSKRNNAEQQLQEAVDNLVLAHEALGQRDTDPNTWDMVSSELAATLLVMGVRRRQSLLSSSSEPLQFQALRLSPGLENLIVEPMERSCKIYESLGTARAAHQAAAAHYQLALYFSKVWTCQRDEAKTREKLSAAFMHYGVAHQYFSKHIGGNEIAFVMLSLDFSNLYSSVTGEECLSKALMCCLDTRAAFSLPVTSDTVEHMDVLANNVEKRVSKLLLSLMKIAKENNLNLDPGQRQRADKYKDMYREALRRKVMASNEANSEESRQTLHVFELLQSLHDLYKS